MCHAMSWQCALPRRSPPPSQRRQDPTSRIPNRRKDTAQRSSRRVARGLHTTAMATVQASDVAARFAAEFARLGYPPSGILRLFRDPFYRGAYAALGVLGESAVQEIVADAARRFPRGTRVAHEPVVLALAPVAPPGTVVP